MTRDFRKDNVNFNNNSSSSSVYSMAAVAGCLLFCIGIIVYALLCV